MMATVAKYGASATWDAGLKALGYPPILASQSSERDRVLAQLKQAKG